MVQARICPKRQFLSTYKEDLYLWSVAPLRAKWQSPAWRTQRAWLCCFHQHFVDSALPSKKRWSRLWSEMSMSTTSPCGLHVWRVGYCPLCSLGLPGATFLQKDFTWAPKALRPFFLYFFWWVFHFKVAEMLKGSCGSSPEQQEPSVRVAEAQLHHSTQGEWKRLWWQDLQRQYWSQT